jgi:hypothetical protein
MILLGHMFCSQCLHGALHFGEGKKCCPVCRSAIAMPKTKGGKQPKNGLFVLEMKLRQKGKGKMPER